MRPIASLLPGVSLQSNKYRIIRVLGQGGFGITYEATQVALHRKVAIKEFFMKEYCERNQSTSHVTLGTSSGSIELVAKFQGKFVREAQMIAGFNHPHIVRIHDVFEENGTAYYVMEFLEGGSLLTKVQQEGPLPEKQALSYIREVSDALDYIHRRNFLHFDVKPSNIMLDSDGRAVLIDFGVSKHYDEAGHQTSSTPIGISKGYAPLEQYQQAEISRFTPVTDIYSLGATLYFLLTGLVPPGASEVNEDGLPPMPTSVSRSVQKAITEAMQPRRKDRPQCVEAFLKFLSEGEEENDVRVVGWAGEETHLSRSESISGNHSFAEEKARQADERRRLEEEKVRQQEEQRQLEEEKAKRATERRRLEAEKARQEEEKRRLEEMKARQEKEKQRLEKEKAQQEDKQRRLEEKRALQEEERRRQKEETERKETERLRLAEEKARQDAERRRQKEIQSRAEAERKAAEKEQIAKERKNRLEQLRQKRAERRTRFVTRVNKTLKSERARTIYVCSALTIVLVGVFVLVVHNSKTPNITPEPRLAILQTKADTVVYINNKPYPMVYVAEGSFMMGSSTDKHKVTLDAYYIGMVEVTQAIWTSVFSNNPSHIVGDELPVDYLSYENCIDFIKKINSDSGSEFCLPTEAQWEYAAIGGAKTKDYVYSGSNEIEQVAWYSKNSDKKIHPVALLRPNELGLYDMTGNVREWCSDYYGDYSKKPEINPQGPRRGDYFCLRGGDVNSSETHSLVLRRSWGSKKSKDYTGLRLVIKIPKKLTEKQKPSVNKTSSSSSTEKKQEKDFSFFKTEYILPLGGAQGFYAEIDGDRDFIVSASWSVDDPSILTIDNIGFGAALAPGRTKIHVRLSLKDKTNPLLLSTTVIVP